MCIACVLCCFLVIYCCICGVSDVCVVGGIMSMGVNFVICGVFSVRCMGCDGGCGAVRLIT